MDNKEIKEILEISKVRIQELKAVKLLEWNNKNWLASNQMVNTLENEYLHYLELDIEKLLNYISE